jgi:hypothetical protein
VETYDSLVRAAQHGAADVPASRVSTDAANTAATSSGV